MSRPGFRVPPSLLPLGALLLAGGCHDQPATMPAVMEPVAARAPQHAAPAPAGLVSVAHEGHHHRFWPYSGEDFRGVPNDPLNLVFFGRSDVREIRAALMALPGTRTGPFAGFTCTWEDAVGGDQVGYGDGSGWTGSVVQLECGDYLTVRAHVRLYPMGEWTVGNAHFDLLIPGTQMHQVIAWESAEQFVASDLARTRLVVSATPVGPLTQAPFFRDIRPEIAMLLPAELRALNPVPPVPPGVPVPLYNDGYATLIELQGDVPRRRGPVEYRLAIPFDQVIPKPFCNTGDEHVLVQGVVHTRQHVQQAPSGAFSRQMQAQGTLMVTPVDPATRQPIGPPVRASVNETYQASLGGAGPTVSNRSNLRIVPGGGGRQMMTKELGVGPHGATRFMVQERC
jgi:hypothetical protein